MQEKEDLVNRERLDDHQDLLMLEIQSLLVSGREAPALNVAPPNTARATAQSLAS